MNRRLSIVMAVCLGIWLVPLAATTAAQQKEKPAKQERVEGIVHMVDKSTKAVTVTLRGKPAERQVVYTDTTRFTFRNKDSSVEELKEGRNVICLGKTNDKNQLVATRIDIRDKT